MDASDAVFIVVCRLDVADDEIDKQEQNIFYWLRFIKGRLQIKFMDKAKKPKVILVGSGKDSLANKPNLWGPDLLTKASSFFMESAILS